MWRQFIGIEACRATTKSIIIVYLRVEDIDTMRGLMLACEGSFFFPTVVVFIKSFDEEELMGLWYKVIS